MRNYLIGRLAFAMLMKPDDGGSQGGGGSGGQGSSGSGAGAGSGGNSGGGTADTAKLVADLAAQNKALIERLEKLEKGSGGGAGAGGESDPDLARKAQLQREADEKKAAESKQLENALKFNLGGKDWLKTNASLLPKTVEGIFEQAEKENYGSAIEKAQAIKVGIIQEFFNLQANVELLTPALKSSLEDFQKLTKTGKQEKAQAIFETVFEPAFEMLKRVKKAEQLSKGFGSPSDSEAAYKQKLMNLSRKHYLGEKQ